jgi:vacuolar-type H+-ATPase subunit H
MIDVTDHRRYAEGKLAESIQAAKESADAQHGLLAQADSLAANTGNVYLDKLVRSVQDLLNTSEEHAKDIAFKGIGCVQEELIRMQQFEYFYTKGKSDAYKEVVQIPARIIAESKPTLV